MLHSILSFISCFIFYINKAPVMLMESIHLIINRSYCSIYWKNFYDVFFCYIPSQSSNMYPCRSRGCFPFLPFPFWRRRSKHLKKKLLTMCIFYTNNNRDLNLLRFGSSFRFFLITLFILVFILILIPVPITIPLFFLFFLLFLLFFFFRLPSIFVLFSIL